MGVDLDRRGAAGQRDHPSRPFPWLKLNHFVGFDDPDPAWPSRHPEGVRRNLDGGMQSRIPVGVDAPELGWLASGALAGAATRYLDSYPHSHPEDEDGREHECASIQQRPFRWVTSKSVGQVGCECDMAIIRRVSAQVYA
jgi:hypothetical protein